MIASGHLKVGGHMVSERGERGNYPGWDFRQHDTFWLKKISYRLKFLI